MDKVSFMRLWDVYNSLLTPTQQEITDLYFNLDLTLSEIADEKGITRQGVNDCLKACKKQLEEFEEKLRFLSSTEKVLDWAENFKAAHPEFTQEITALGEIIKRN